MDTAAIARELEPTVAELFDRHLQRTKEWFPHELTPWERHDQAPIELPQAAKSALFVNLLTEDNLPYYFQEIDAMFGASGIWGEWNRRWTAEEGRHSIVMRDWISVTNALDPYELERGRMAQVSHGFPHEISGLFEGLAYVTLQELATRISHHNTGKFLDDASGLEVMKRVGNDENLHFLFYRDAATAALQIDPSSMMIAIDHQVREFEMPGTGIIDFATHSRIIADAGIYDFQIHHDQILQPVVIRHWNIEALTGLTDEAERARESCLKHITKVGRVAKRLAERRERELAAAAG